MKTTARWLAAAFVLIGLAGERLSAGAAETIPVGVARIDITPDHPVRLAGYASRQAESAGVAERIWAKALAIGSNAGDGPAVLIMVENCGVPAAMTAYVVERLAAKAGLKRERVVLCSTHIHTGPWLAGMLTLHTDREHSGGASRAHEPLHGAVEGVAGAGGPTGPRRAQRRAVLSWTQGSVGFAMNRRPSKDGRVTGLGVNPEGPVDHSVPLLRVTDPQGKLIAVLLNYACHCTTLGGRYNQIHGDWSGHAQKFIEAEHPGATALVSIGCGADANPDPRDKPELAVQHGRTMADEVNRLLAGPLQATLRRGSRPNAGRSKSRWRRCPAARSSNAAWPPARPQKLRRPKNVWSPTPGRCWPGWSTAHCRRASTTR